MLENLLGSEAPTSFMGQTERAVQRAGDVVGAGTEALRGNIPGAIIRGSKAALDTARGISIENQMKAIEKLLREGMKGGTNFGR